MFAALHLPGVFIFAAGMLFVLHLKSLALDYERVDPRIRTAEHHKLSYKYDSAIFLLDRILQDRSSKGSDGAMVRALLEKSEVYLYDNDISTATVELDAAQAVIEKGGLSQDQEALMALFYLTKAFLIDKQIDFQSLQELSHGDSILHYINQAEHALKGVREDHLLLWAKIKWRKADRYFKLNQDLNLAEQNYTEALQIYLAEAGDLDLKSAWLFFDLTKFYRQQADYERAMLFARQASYVFNHPENDVREAYLKSLLLIGNNYYNMSEFEAAARQYRFLIAEIENHFNECDLNSLVLLLQNLGAILSYDLGDHSSAIRYLKRAVTLNPRQSKEDLNLLSGAYLSLAHAYASIDEMEQAGKYEHLQLQLAEDLKYSYPKDYSRSLRYMGNFLTKIDLFDSALHYYQASINALFEGYDSTDIYSNPDFTDTDNPEDILYVVFEKAEAFKGKYQRSGVLRDLEASLQLYGYAFRLQDLIVNSNMLEGSLLDISEFHNEAFSNGVETALELYDLTGDKDYFEQGLQFIERRKYYLLYQTMQRGSGQADQTSGPASGYSADLIGRINELNHRLQDSTLTPLESFEIRRQLIPLYLKQGRTAEVREAAVSPGIIPKSDQNAIITLNEVQNELLNDHQIVVEFYETESDFRVMLIGKSFISMIRLNLDRTLRSQIQAFVNHIALLDPAQTELVEFRRFLSSAYALNRHLFEPVVREIERMNVRNARDLKYVIIPDGIISYLPFEAMVSEKHEFESINYWAVSYLCREYNFNYAYSLQVLKSQSSLKSKVKTPRILGLSYSAELPPQEIQNGRKSGGEELPYSAEELKKISRWVNGKFVENQQATEHLFKSEAEKYQIIHLALHGITDTTDVFSSRLEFKRQEDQVDDGHLYAYELYDLNLSDARMVVLSACETGIGKRFKGEGQFSIARGFVAAGCPSIVMSLWKVNDKSTAQLMDHFYEHLAEGLPKDEALRMAKLNYLEQSNDFTAHPANWAAFIMLGDASPLPFGKWYQSWLIWGGLSLLLAMMLILIIKRPFRSGSSSAK